MNLEKTPDTTENITIYGIAYDSCLLTPMTREVNGKTIEEYGLNIGLDSKTAETLQQKIDGLLISAVGYLPANIVSPIYTGDEINIEQPYAISVGSMYRPKHLKYEVQDGSKCMVVVNIRCYKGSRHPGVALKVNYIRPIPQKPKKTSRYFKKRNK